MSLIKEQTKAQVASANRRHSKSHQSPDDDDDGDNADDVAGVKPPASPGAQTTMGKLLSWGATFSLDPFFWPTSGYIVFCTIPKGGAKPLLK